MLRSSTVTQIERVKATDMTPAIAELWTTGGEHFPIFDTETHVAAYRAWQDKAYVLLEMWQSARTSYVRNIHVIDVTADSIQCPDCTSTYKWNQRDVPGREQSHRPHVEPPPPMVRLSANVTDGSTTPFFRCFRCERHIYLQPLKAVPINLPTVARARLNRVVDGLFALDHLHHQATLMDSIPSDTASMPPYQGVHAELEPFEQDFVLDHHEMIPYRSVKLRPSLSLRLQGDPFRGRDVYEVL